MGKITGITVILHERVKTGLDPFEAPIYEEKTAEVENVLVAPASSTEVIDSMQLYGKKATYNLAVPKGDTHNWQDARIEFFGEEWLSFGIPIEGIEENIPTDWNKKVQVARYE